MDERTLRRALEEMRGANVEAGASAYGSDEDFLGALAGMRRGYEQGGMTSADRLAQQQAMEESARAERGREGALMQNMAARGMGGGGSELAARLSNQQAATQGQWQAGAQQAGQAQQRALESLRGWGGMAGQRSGASDAIREFNASQRLGKAQALAQLQAQLAAAKKKKGWGQAIGTLAGGGLGFLGGGPAGMMAGSALGGGAGSLFD